NAMISNAILNKLRNRLNENSSATTTTTVPKSLYNSQPQQHSTYQRGLPTKAAPTYMNGPSKVPQKAATSNPLETLFNSPGKYLDHSQTTSPNDREERISVEEEEEESVKSSRKSSNQSTK